METWVYVHEPYNTTGTKHNATNNQYTYASLSSGITFTVYVQGKGSSSILQQDFTTGPNTVTPELTPAPEPSPVPTPIPTPEISPLPNPSQTSSYLEPVILPTCDINNPEVQFIQSKDDWKHINDNHKRIFCVSPGDYRSLNNIKLTVSGTAEKRRYIMLNNGNNTHPAKLPIHELSNFSIHLQNADYWIIDRASAIDTPNISHNFLVDRGSSNNIFNKIFTQNVFHTMWIRHQAHNNTIQNSRFDGITQKGAEADLSTINIIDWDVSVEMLGTKVINNEFVNVKLSLW